MKKLLIISFTIFTILCIAFNVFAEKNYFVDGVGLLDGIDSEYIESKLRNCSSYCNVDIVIVTVNDIGVDYSSISDGEYDWALTCYADDYYDYNGYSEDGVLLLVDMYGHGWATSTKGRAMTALTDDILYEIEEDVVRYLKYGDYRVAFATFADDCSEYICYYNENGYPKDVDNGGYRQRNDKSLKSFLSSPGKFIGAGVVGLIAALIGVGKDKSEMTSVRPNNMATNYLVDGSFELLDSQDVFLYRNVSKVRRSDDSSGGRSGGSSHHTSSSGSSHGGHSGRF